MPAKRFFITLSFEAETADISHGLLYAISDDGCRRSFIF
jgi:hypothetical protein